MRRAFAKLMALFRAPAIERELARELESHLALLQEEYEARGHTAVDARRKARMACGGLEQIKELHRDERGLAPLENFIKDLRYGMRNLGRAPGFSIVAIITLGLGIGASTAIFSVVNAVLLRPLDYKDSSRLVTILHAGTNPVATANYIDWRDQSPSFEAMGAASWWSPNLTSGDRPEHLNGLKITQSLLPLLGVPPLMGHLFAPGENQAVVLSYRLWERDFHRDPTIIGRLIRLDRDAYTVAAVMPPSFKFAPFWATHAELWVPDTLAQNRSARDDNHLRVFARLKPGVTLLQARAGMAAITARLEKQYPATNQNVIITPLSENVSGKVQTPLLLLLGAVGFVLLMTCANVAHMLLARTAERQKEIALRTALGAARSRVVFQLMTENLLLAVLGAIAGLMLTLGITKALVLLSPAYIPRIETVTVDTSVLLFELGVTLVAALAFGLTPALHAAAGDLAEALKQSVRTGTGGALHNRLRGALVASEFALAFMLLIGAGLMIRTFIELENVNPGFEPRGVLTMTVSVAGTNEEAPARRAVFYRELLDRLKALPGVVSVGAINHLPLGGDTWTRGFQIEGRSQPRPGEEPGAVYRVVMPGYFETMRLALRNGRLISDQDNGRSPRVVVINERAARQYWPGSNPLGARIWIDGWLTVAGVVADAKQSDWTAEPTPEVYLAGLQSPDFLGGAAPVSPPMSYLTLVLRASGDPAAVTPSVQQTIWSLDRGLPISDITAMDEVVAHANAGARFEMLVLCVFGGVALLLAAVGIYGVTNYSVTRRTREIGIRVSLGANRSVVLRMILLQAMRQALIGATTGFFGAGLLARLMNNMLYGVAPVDPATFATVGFTLVLAALMAAGVPACKAMRVEPVIALRSE